MLSRTVPLTHQPVEASCPKLTTDLRSRTKHAMQKREKMTRTLGEGKVKPVTSGKRTYHGLIGNSVPDGLSPPSCPPPPTWKNQSVASPLSHRCELHVGHSNLSTVRKRRGQFKNAAKQSPPLFCVEPIGRRRVQPSPGWVEGSSLKRARPNSANTSGYLNL